uniref:Sosondowah ankyrin repeat domain family member D n=1 Tax=Jaculus jaculus TaxID=51337 RepID=A0A8C5L5E6_JACJA
MAQPRKTANPTPRASLQPAELNTRGACLPRPCSTDSASLGSYPGQAAATATGPAISRDPHFHSLQTLSDAGWGRAEAPRELLGTAASRRGRLAEERSGVPSSRRSGGSRLCLEPREHAWILASAQGRFEVLEKLLEEDPGLLMMVDPITGYSLLHWLAKHGRHEELIKVHDLAQKYGLALDVNISGSGGFTPLHLAARQGHEMVIKVLVGALGADTSRRDYSGRRACYYLQPNTSHSLRELTGAEDPQVTKESECDSSSGITGWSLRRTPSTLRAKSMGTHPKEAAVQAKGNTSSRKGVRGNSFLRQLFPFFQNR